MSPLNGGHGLIFYSKRFLVQDFAKDSDENYRMKAVLIRQSAIHVCNYSAHNTGDATCVHYLSAQADFISHLETVHTAFCISDSSETAEMEQNWNM
jgi:hypothetical protein